MNSPTGKAILAKARNGDFAHPGEEEAIRLVAANSTKSGVHRVLDVGCGRGGTAAWFQRNGWGHVVGVDVDAESIEHAQIAHPDVEFVAMDVGAFASWNVQPFDFACLFNSFYAFPDQHGALRQIRSVCRAGAAICIFDYAQSRDAVLPAVLGSEIGRPLAIEDMPAWLREAGWTEVAAEDLTSKYVSWYDDLLTAFERNRGWIVENFGDDWRRYVVEWYSALLAALESRTLRGMVFRAIAA
jgi:SAM-dependent methyltransferase